MLTLLSVCAASFAEAQDASQPSAAQPLAPPATARPAGQRDETLQALESRAGVSEVARRRLDQEIAGLKQDRSRLGAALVTAAREAREAEERVRAVETRLGALDERETALRQRLQARRFVIAEILAALQRMGRAAPPPILLRADDVVAAIRAAILLGGVTPPLQQEARELADTLAELGRIRTAVAADRAAIEAEFVVLAGERDRVAALIRLRQERIASVEAEFIRERQRGEAIGAEARTLQDLNERVESAHDSRPSPRIAVHAPADGGRSVGSAARPDPSVARDGEAAAQRSRERFASASARDPLRLGPRQPFPEMRGSLPRPVVGRTLREFGAPDGSGGTLRGSISATRPRAIVTAPADATIVFAGPFRLYGRLLIMNVGGGYYLILAGLDVVNVEVGQFVLAGEPVGLMGSISSPSASLGVVEAEGPVLYVELRKDGGSIDPSPWWAKSQGERARG